MKLLFLIENMSIETGGPALAIFRLSELLIEEKGIKISVACSRLNKKGLPFNNRINFFILEKSRTPIFSWFISLHHLSSLISSHDVLFVSGIWGPIDGLALRFVSKRTKPFYIRACGMLEPYIISKHPLKKRIALSLYVRHNLKKAQGVIVNSHSEGQNVIKQGISGEKILIIPNGINIPATFENKKDAKKSFGIDPDKKVLLYLGRLHPKKGLHYLLKAVASILSEIRNLQVLVAGDFADEKYRNEITNLVDSLHLHEIFIFTGLVSGVEKERHFCAADCFILPSESEGLPNAVVEALSYGLPSIITRGCNIPEVAEYDAGLVIELSLPALIKALKWFLSPDTPLQYISENARKLIKDYFSVEEYVNNYRKILQENL